MAKYLYVSRIINRRTGIATKLIGNEDLMLAMYDTPDFVHQLMDIVTNAIADTIKAMERWAGDPNLIVKNDRDPMPGGGARSMGRLYLGNLTRNT